MSNRFPRLRGSARRIAICAVAGMAALAGCSGGDGGDGGDKGGGGGEQLPGTSQSQWIFSEKPARVDLLALDKTSDKAVTARLRITNFGEERFQISQPSITVGINPDNDAYGITLIDVVNRKRYWPLVTADDKCACTRLEPLEGFLNQGESIEYFVNFPVPPVQKVTVRVPNTPPFTAVPISNRPGPVKAPPGQPAADPATLRLKAPRITSIIDRSTAVDGSGEQTEDDKQVEVRLSADVLFALNKADLTPRAQAALKNVAARINASKATAVKIDGYTDDSGTDAINVPLSQRRAQAVRRALAPLVTRPGVTYQIAGHGSADPVAENDSEDNRRRNRRVTITFAR